jgi:hypothetical protein
MKITIQHDDDCLDIIEKVNEALKEHDLFFEADDGDFDGYQPFTLKQKEGS